MNCENQTTCRAGNLCKACAPQFRSYNYSNQNTQPSLQQNVRSEIVQKGFEGVGQSEEVKNQQNQPAEVEEQLVQAPPNIPPANPPQQQQINQQNQNQAQNQGQNQPNQINQQPRPQQNQIERYINFKLDVQPNQKFSISRNPDMVPHLYSLNPDKLFQNILKYSQKYVRGEFYEKQTKAEITSESFNTLQNIQPLLFKQPNKFSQFFHALNMMMGITYFISLEQSIQHAILNLRNPEIIELSLSRNKMFDPDNFLGGIHNSTFQTYKLQKFEAKSRFELLDSSLLEGKLIEFLQNQNKSPILVWTSENDKHDFIVIKRFQGEWYFFNQDSNIFRITKHNKKLIQDLSDSADEINQQDLILQHFGPINIFYSIRVCELNQRKTDKILFNMFRLIYQQKQYLDQVTFWADFKQLAEQQLKLPDIQNNKFVLPSLKYIPGNSYKNQNTQNQYKQQKKQETKKRQREELSSEEDTDYSPIASPESSKIKMITRNKQDQQAIDTSKRKKQ